MMAIERFECKQMPLPIIKITFSRDSNESKDVMTKKRKT